MSVGDELSAPVRAEPNTEVLHERALAISDLINKTPRNPKGLIHLTPIIKMVESALGSSCQIAKFKQRREPEIVRVAGTRPISDVYEVIRTSKGSGTW